MPREEKFSPFEYGNACRESQVKMIRELKEEG
jgi:hypothetical protein